MSSQPEPRDLHRLIYSSQAEIKLDQPELERLLGTSRERNEANRITGILLLVDPGPHRPGYFVQLLEGPRTAVEETFGRISRDDLHHEVHVLTRESAPARQFAQWTMHREDMEAAAFVALARKGPDSTLDRLVRDPWTAEAAIRHYAP